MEKDCWEKTQELPVQLTKTDQTAKEAFIKSNDPEVHPEIKYNFLSKSSDCRNTS